MALNPVNNPHNPSPFPNQFSPAQTPFEESGLKKVSNFVINYAHSYLDHFRSSIPSDRDMLIENLPGLYGQPLLTELQQIDGIEKLQLATPKEKTVNSLRLNHVLASDLTKAGALVTGATSILPGHALKIVSLCAGLSTFAVGTCLNRFTTVQETAREYCWIRLNRLKIKINQIQIFLDGAKLNNDQQKIKQFDLAINGLNGIVERCWRIFNHNEGNYNSFSHPPQGGFRLNFPYTPHKQEAYIQVQNDQVKLQRKYTPLSPRDYNYVVPPTEEMLELHQDVKEIKKNNKNLKG